MFGGANKQPKNGSGEESADLSIWEYATPIDFTKMIMEQVEFHFTETESGKRKLGKEYTARRGDFATRQSPRLIFSA